ARRICANVRLVRALPCAKGGRNEACSECYRRRGHFGLIVGMGTANAQSYRRYGPARAYTPQGYTPQSRGPVRREGGLRTAPFSDPNSPEATGGGSLGYNRTVPHW